MSATAASHIVHDIQDGVPDTSQMTLIKSRTFFNIKSENKQLWLKVSPCSLKYGYRDHQYKSTSPGNIVVSDTGNLSEVVEAVDQFVIDRLTSDYSGKSLNNVAITNNTVAGMFKGSLYNGTLQVSVDINGKDKCRIFDHNSTPIVSQDLTQVLKRGLAVIILIQPNFAWMMGPKIGIRWDAKQIKIIGAATDEPEPDSDDEEDGNNAQPRTAQENLAIFQD